MMRIHTGDLMESSRGLMESSLWDLVESNNRDLMETKDLIQGSSRDLIDSVRDMVESSRRDLMESSSCPNLSPCNSPNSIQVRIDHSTFVVDRRLLVENCEYFRALFQSGMRDCHQQEVKLQCVGVQGFLVLLQVLNGERPMLNSDQIVGATECTAFLQATALTKHLINVINSENCLLMCHTAATFGVLDLFHSSALFIRDLYPDVQEEIHCLPQALVDYIESLHPSSYMAVCSHSPSFEQLKDQQRTVCYLDESSRDWNILTHLPMNASTTMAGLAVLDNKLFIMGGVHDVSKKVVETGFCYSPEMNSWSRVCGPQQLRYNFPLVSSDGCLYALGGEFNMKPLSSVEKFRVSDGSWTSVSALPCPAALVASAVTMNRIFICLWRGQGATDVHEYLHDQDQWVLVTTLTRQQSYGLCMVAHRDNLYLMRNGPCEDFLQCVMDRYSLSSGQWTSMGGQYQNSKSSLFTAVVRGDSVFTLSQQVTSEFYVSEKTWQLRRQMNGFGRIGSIYTFLMRFPRTHAPLRENCETQNQNQNQNQIEPRPCLGISTHCSENMGR